MALINKLEDIGNAIRSKTGGTELLKLDEMPAAIESIETGGGGAELPEEILTITGNCNYRMANNGWNAFIDYFGNKIITENINNTTYMFNSSNNLEIVDFTINFSANSPVDINNMFANCNKLKQLPQVGTYRPMAMNRMFYNCENLREIPSCYEDNIDFTYLESQTSATSGRADSLFQNCYSLRELPMGMIKSGNAVIRYDRSYLYGISACYALNELKNLPLFFTSTWTSNAFSTTFTSLCRVKDIIFETNIDGTVKEMNWKSQVIDLTVSVGYTPLAHYITNYNSGITADKQVKDDATYQALKNDPDYFTTMNEYSRYNHDSAVNTINSLPDTSAYLASAGGTNTIKFKGASGSLTDGGAINTLTAEEIAVAAAKGWTVTLT